MLARTWPPVDYWLTADDRMVATAIALLEAEHDAIEKARGER
jgi:hypothetical protein